MIRERKQGITDHKGDGFPMAKKLFLIYAIVYRDQVVAAKGFGVTDLERRYPVDLAIGYMSIIASSCLRVVYSLALLAKAYPNSRFR